MLGNVLLSLWLYIYKNLTGSILGKSVAVIGSTESQLESRLCFTRSIVYRLSSTFRKKLIQENVKHANLLVVYFNTTMLMQSSAAISNAAMIKYNYIN